jgi:hypothetical protein
MFYTYGLPRHKAAGNQIQGILREDLGVQEEICFSHLPAEPDREAASKTLNTKMMLHSLHQVVHS